jgi:hypothetical protein
LPQAEKDAPIVNIGANGAAVLAAAAVWRFCTDADLPDILACHALAANAKVAGN